MPRCSTMALVLAKHNHLTSRVTEPWLFGAFRRFLVASIYIREFPYEKHQDSTKKNQHQSATPRVLAKPKPRSGHAINQPISVGLRKLQRYRFNFENSTDIATTPKTQPISVQLRKLNRYRFNLQIGLALRGHWPSEKAPSLSTGPLIHQMDFAPKLKLA